MKITPITAIPTVAASRTLSTPASPSTPLVGVNSWRNRVPSLRVPTVMRNESVFGTSTRANYATTANHNSIVSTGVASVKAGGNAHGAAKQAAPPRGEPR
jgi:hypothetical protein